MALTLTATITETQTAFRVTGIVPGTVDIGYLFRLGDELLEVRSFGRKDISILNGHATQNVRDMNAWIVSRHLEDTAAAGHDAGTAVLGSADAWVAGTSDAPPEPWAGPGGGSGPALSDATPLPASGEGEAGAGTEASRDTHAHPEAAAPALTLEDVRQNGNIVGGPIVAQVDGLDLVILELAPGGLTQLRVNDADGSTRRGSVTVDGDGEIVIESADDVKFTLRPDGLILLQNAAFAGVNLNVDGSVDISSPDSTLHIGATVTINGDEVGPLSDATPEADAGSGDAGVGAAASRGDHAHPTGGATPSLAEVLAEGADTGGLGIVSETVDTDADVSATATASGTGQAFASSRAEDGSGSSGEVTVSAASDARATLHATGASGGLALATSKADSVDLAADVSATATTTGGGNPKANRTAEATDTAGNAEANTTANAKAQADGNTTVHSLNNRAGADVDVQSGGSGDATALRAATANGSGGANVSSTALVLGAGTATNVVTATAVGGTASIGPVADATSALVMVTGLPTSDPVVAGALYSLNGVVMVSAG